MWIFLSCLHEKFFMHVCADYGIQYYFCIPIVNMCCICLKMILLINSVHLMVLTLLQLQDLLRLSSIVHFKDCIQVCGMSVDNRKGRHSEIKDESKPLLHPVKSVYINYSVSYLRYLLIALKLMKLAEHFVR